MTIMYRRQFLRAAAATLLLAALALSVSANVGLAQQKSDKPKLQLSEVRAAATNYVDSVSRHARESMGVELTAEQKTLMVNDIISGIYAQGTYAFVDP